MGVVMVNFMGTLFKSARNAKIAKKNFKKCQVGEGATIWPLKASKLDINARLYLTKLVSKYIHNRIIYKEKWCHSTLHEITGLVQLQEFSSPLTFKIVLCSQK